MDGEINSHNIPNAELQVPMWRSIARWLEKPASEYAHKYEQDGMMVTPVALALQMDVAYALLLDCPSFNAILTQVPDLEDMRVYFADFKDKKYDGVYEHSSRSIALDVSELAALSEHGLLPHFFSNGSHEYRHAYQYAVRRGAHNSTNPHIMALRSFIYEADANAFQCNVAFEAMKFSGVDIFWDFCRMTRGSIAEAFIELAEDDLLSYITGEAQQAAFLAFFENEGKMNFYADHTMEQLAEHMDISPYEAAERLFAHERAQAQMREHKRLPRLLPKPGQQFKAVNAPQAPCKPQLGRNFAMALEAPNGDLLGRPVYGLFDDFDPKSVDYYMRGLSDNRYAALLKMTAEIMKFDGAVSVELAKMRDRYSQAMSKGFESPKF